MRMSSLSQPCGIYPILYAFFDDAGGLDRPAFRQQVEAVIQAGAQGVAVLGLITEVAALTPRERQTLVEWAFEDIAGRAPLFATIAGSTLEETIVLAKGAEAAGASSLILQPPLGAKPGEAELSEFFGAAMRAVSISVGIQNAPEFLGVGLSAPAVKQLAAAHPNFTLMKGEGPVVVVKPYVDLLGPDLAIFNGRGGLELPDNLRAGCAGLVPAPDCADIQIQIYEAWHAGDYARMDALYCEILPYVVFAMQSMPIAISLGKRTFVRRAGIDNSCACRIVRDPPQPFFEDAMRRWSSRFGAYRRTHARQGATPSRGSEL
jgi:2-keto-3-deoxy-L-arabinonate dehydratase